MSVFDRQDHQKLLDSAIKNAWGECLKNKDFQKTLQAFQKSQSSRSQIYRQANYGLRTLYAYIKVGIPHRLLTEYVRVYVNNYFRINPHQHSFFIYELAHSKIFDEFSTKQKLKLLTQYMVNSISYFDTVRAGGVIRRVLSLIDPSQSILEDILFEVITSKEKDMEVETEDSYNVHLIPYLFLIFMESALFVVRKKWDLIHTQQIAKVHLVYLNFIRSWVQNINPQLKVFLQKLLITCVNLLSSNHFLVANFLNTLSNSLHIGCSSNTVQKKRLCAELIEFMTVELIKKCDRYTKYQIFQSQKQETKTCEFCQKTFKNIFYIGLSTKSQEHLVPLCKECKLSQKKVFRDNPKSGAFDLLLILCSDAKQEDPYDQLVVSQEMRMYELMCPFGVQNEFKQKQIRKVIQSTLHMKAAQNILKLRTLANNAMLFHSKLVDMQSRISLGLEQWVYQASQPTDTNKRLRAFKSFNCFMGLFKLYESQHFPEFIRTFLQQLTIIFNHRIYDVSQGVRKAVIKVVLEIFRISSYDQVNYFVMIQNKIKNDTLQIKKSIIPELKKIIPHLKKMEAEAIFSIFVILLNQMEQDDTDYNDLCTRALQNILNDSTIQKLYVDKCLDFINSQLSQTTLRNLAKVRMIAGNDKYPGELDFLILQRKTLVTPSQAYYLKQMCSFNAFMMSPCKTLLIKFIVQSSERKGQDLLTISYLVECLSLILDNNKKLDLSLGDCNQLIPILKRYIGKYTHVPSIASFLRLIVQIRFLTNNFEDIDNMCNYYLMEIKNLPAFGKQITSEQATSLNRNLYLFALIRTISYQLQAQPKDIKSFNLAYQIVCSFSLSNMEQVKRMSVTCLNLFWKFKPEYIESTMQLLKKVLLSSHNQNIAMSICDGVNRAILSSIEQKDDKRLNICLTLFRFFYEKYYTSKNIQLRIKIGTALQMFLALGMLSMRTANKIVYRYLCDPDKTVKSLANKIIVENVTFVTFENFKELMLDVIEYIEEEYSKIVAGADDGENFFETLIEKKQVLLKKSDDYQVTFFKKFCSSLHDRTLFSSQKIYFKMTELFCRIVLATKKFSLFDFKLILAQLCHIYDSSIIQIWEIVKRWKQKSEGQHGQQNITLSMNEIKELIHPTTLRQFFDLKQNETNKDLIYSTILNIAQCVYLVKTAIHKLVGNLDVKTAIRKYDILSQIQIIETNYQQVEVPDNLLQIYKQILENSKIQPRKIFFEVQEKNMLKIKTLDVPRRARKRKIVREPLEDDSYELNFESHQQYTQQPSMNADRSNKKTGNNTVSVPKKTNPRSRRIRQKSKSKSISRSISRSVSKSKSQSQIKNKFKPRTRSESRSKSKSKSQQKTKGRVHPKSANKNSNKQSQDRQKDQDTPRFGKKEAAELFKEEEKKVQPIRRRRDIKRVNYKE